MFYQLLTGNGNFDLAGVVTTAVGDVVTAILLVVGIVFAGIMGAMATTQGAKVAVKWVKGMISKAS